MFKNKEELIAKLNNRLGYIHIYYEYSNSIEFTWDNHNYYAELSGLVLKKYSCHSQKNSSSKLIEILLKT